MSVLGILAALARKNISLPLHFLKMPPFCAIHFSIGDFCHVKRYVWSMAIAVGTTVCIVLHCLYSSSQQPKANPATPPPPAPVTPAPDSNRLPHHANPITWEDLTVYARSLTRAEFEKRLHFIFDPFHGMDPFLEITPQYVFVFRDPKSLAPKRIWPGMPITHEIPFFLQNMHESHGGLAKDNATDLFRDEGVQLELPLAANEKNKQPPLPPYRTPTEFRALPKPPTKPLDRLRVAIDPGHIGGKWGQVEDRSTFYRGIGRIQEGDMNIITARILKEKLEQLGANVFLTREDMEPATPLRPDDLINEAETLLLKTNPKRATRLKSLPEHLARQDLRNIANFLFCRFYEKRARAQKIRSSFEPDITVVLYINATPRSGRARLTPANQVILFVHGSYIREELQDPDQRLRLLYKLLDNATPIETEVASAIARAFVRHTGLPAVPYGNSKNTREVVPDYRYVVARNLAANREIDGPVVTTEPFFMNNHTVASRLVAGDYDGTRVFDGKPYPSIFRQYAQCVLEGLLECYAGQTFQAHEEIPMSDSASRLQEIDPVLAPAPSSALDLLFPNPPE